MKAKNDIYTLIDQKDWGELSAEEQALALEQLGSREAYEHLQQAGKAAHQSLSTETLPPSDDDFLLIMAKVQGSAPAPADPKPAPGPAWYAVPIPFYKAVATVLLVALAAFFWRGSLEQQKQITPQDLAQIKDTIYQVIKVRDTLYMERESSPTLFAEARPDTKRVKRVVHPVQQREPKAQDPLAIDQPDYRKDFNRGMPLRLDSSTGIFAREEALPEEKLSSFANGPGKP